MSEEPKRKRMKLKAFTAPKDKATKDIVKRNATTVPLLSKLPREVRDRIWGYVLGHQTIHIGPDNTHTVCDATISEHAAYELSKSEEYQNSCEGATYGDGYDLRIASKRHGSCYVRLADTLGWIEPRIWLDIRILRVCRQVYIEANPILWKTTIWSIYDLDSLKSFKLGRDHNNVQRALLRKFHLAESIIYPYPDNAKSKDLTGLLVICEARISYPDTLRYPELDVLHLDMTCDCATDEIQHFFRAKEVTVIYDTGGTWQERVADAQALRERLLELPPKAAQREKEKKELRDKKKADREKQKLLEGDGTDLAKDEPTETTRTLSRKSKAHPNSTP